MEKLILVVKDFWDDEEGVTAIEYALIAVLNMVMIIAGATAIGVDLNVIFSYIAS